MAGTSQSGTQVGRLKPVIQGGPAGEILSWSPRAGYGRVYEVTNGIFVEAKQENRWLAVRLLWSNPAGRLCREVSFAARGSCRGLVQQRSVVKMSYGGGNYSDAGGSAPLLNAYAFVASDRAPLCQLEQVY